MGSVLPLVSRNLTMACSGRAISLSHARLVSTGGSCAPLMPSVGLLLHHWHDRKHKQP
jgi:cell division FtsZ-interacting protein ZapD